MKEIKIGQIKDWITSRKRDFGKKGGKIKDSTIKHEFYTLSAAFALGVERGILQENLCKKIVLKRLLNNGGTANKTALSVVEIQHLIESAENHTKLFIQIAACTAARKGEILQLQWEDIDFKEKTITFRHDPENDQRIKTKRTVTLPIGSYLINALKKVKLDAIGPWIFHHPDGSRMLDVKQSFSTAVKRAGLGANVTPHILRHSVNTILMEKHIPQSDVRDFLRHADFRMTSHYGHSREERLRSVAESLNFDRRVSESPKLVQQVATPNAVPDENLKEILSKVATILDTVSTVESMSCWLERETGIEPATLSLEG